MKALATYSEEMKEIITGTAPFRQFNMRALVIQILKIKKKETKIPSIMSPVII
jgi:hypothetical protein